MASVLKLVNIGGLFSKSQQISTVIQSKLNTFLNTQCYLFKRKQNI